MSKEGRTYAIIRLESWKKVDFNAAKRLKIGDELPQLITSDYDSMVKSLDGTLGIIKWRGVEPKGVRAHVVETFDLQGAQKYLEANRNVWFEEKPKDLVLVRTVAQIKTVATSKPVRWAALTAAGAAAAGAAYYFLY